MARGLSQKSFIPGFDGEKAAAPIYGQAIVPYPFCQVLMVKRRPRPFMARGLSLTLYPGC